MYKHLYTCVQLERVFSDLDESSDEQKVQKLQTLKLRYFSPREVANLMGFPAGFSESLLPWLLLLTHVLSMFCCALTLWDVVQRFQTASPRGSATKLWETA